MGKKYDVHVEKLLRYKCKSKRNNTLVTCYYRTKLLLCFTSDRLKPVTNDFPVAALPVAFYPLPICAPLKLNNERMKVKARTRSNENETSSFGLNT